MRWTEERYQAYLNRHKANNPVSPFVVAPVPKSPKDRMNSTERRYAEHVLEPMEFAGEITGWMFEGLKFRVAEGAFYKPDFNVFYPDGVIENIEIKGGEIHEASRVRFLAVRENFIKTMFRFKLMQWAGGAWQERLGEV